MYANLQVDIAARPARNDSPTETVYAWKIDLGLMPDAALLHLDSNDGDGDHVIPAGERIIDLHAHQVSITSSLA